MKKRILSGLAVLTMLLSITACTTKKEDRPTDIEENIPTNIEAEKDTTVIDDTDETAEESNSSVNKIDFYENVVISDWLSEDTVVVSKKNITLDKMKLEELPDFYPRSLYLFNIDTKEYQLLKEEENLFLGDATLSPDKKHLLYTGNTLGDSSYYVINVDTLETFNIHKDNTVAAYSAEWADKDTVIGTSYSGNVYLASTIGEIVILDGLDDEAFFIVRKIKDKIYYNTNSDTSLMVWDQGTKSKTPLNIDNVSRVLPSPDESQMLVLQDTGSSNRLLLYDIDSGTEKTIVEGSEISGISWSPDQTRIAYYKKTEVTDSSFGSLYLYDLMTDEHTQIVEDVQNPSTSWSPTGTKLAYAQWDGKMYSSSIVYLKLTTTE